MKQTRFHAPCLAPKSRFLSLLCHTYGTKTSTTKAEIQDTFVITRRRLGRIHDTVGCLLAALAPLESSLKQTELSLFAKKHVWKLRYLYHEVGTKWLPEEIKHPTNMTAICPSSKGGTPKKNTIPLPQLWKSWMRKHARGWKIQALGRPLT